MAKKRRFNFVLFFSGGFYFAIINPCHLSSAVEQHFRKVKVPGSSPGGGSAFDFQT